MTLWEQFKPQLIKLIVLTGLILLFATFCTPQMRITRGWHLERDGQLVLAVPNNPKPQKGE